MSAARISFALAAIHLPPLMTGTALAEDEMNLSDRLRNGLDAFRKGHDAFETE